MKPRRLRIPILLKPAFPSTLLQNAHPSYVVALVVVFCLTGCLPTASLPAATPVAATVAITIRVDGSQQAHTLPTGLTVREALAHAGVALGELDRLSPPPYEIISDGLEVVVTRVTETFETEEVTIPYGSQTVRNEGLPEGERRLLQVGQNGLDELTYRTVFEDGVQVSRSLVKRISLTPAVDEIIMIGSQGAFTLVPIGGTLAYINGRNAWIMRGNSGNRTALTTDGDLDGFVFDLSPDGQWLLYSRRVSDTDAADFNTLWAIPTVVTPTSTVTRTQAATRTNPIAISLPISNVLYAEWSPTAPRTVAYSTAQKITRAPGWEANNDLWLMRWGTGRDRQLVFTPTQLLDSSAGGLYGWWGTGYAFAPSGEAIAYARTDSIGLVQFSDITEVMTPTVTASELSTFQAFNTHSDWAWYPALRWSHDGAFLYSIVHGPPIGLEAPEDSPAFDLTLLTVPEGRSFTLIPRAGMFSNPLPSPPRETERGELEVSLAFLQATDPNNSPFSSYRLGLMDRDGSNVRFIFPPPDQPGLPATATLAWAPDGSLLSVVYEGNVWLLDPASDLTQQLTGDGQSTHVRWGP